MPSLLNVREGKPEKNSGLCCWWNSMLYIPDLLRRLHPLRIELYFDRIIIWLKRPLSKERLAWLAGECGPGGLDIENERAWFDWRYQQKIEVYQPSKAALRYLANLDDDVLLNYVEVTVDFIMPDYESKELLLRAFKDGFLQPRHRNRQNRSYPEGFTTRKLPERGERRTGFWLQWYSGRPCKLNQQPHCFHFEGKHQGVQSVRGIGISHPRDLVDFDFNAYFAKYLCLYQIDLERLGRYDDNKRSYAKRKRAIIGPSGYNTDQRRGSLIYRALSAHADQEDRSLQQFVDRYGRGPYLTRHDIYIHLQQRVTSQEALRRSAYLTQDATN